MKQKHNWDALKSEFLESEFYEVKAFLSQKWIKLNGWWIAKKTKGWWKDKQAMADRIINEAMELNVQKQAESLAIPMDTLKKAKNAAVARVMWMLAKREWEDGKVEEIKLSIADIERILRIIKTELGEPTTISKNENLNTEKIEWIHVLLWWNVIDSSKSVKNNA